MLDKAGQNIRVSLKNLLTTSGSYIPGAFLEDGPPSFS